MTDLTREQIAWNAGRDAAADCVKRNASNLYRNADYHEKASLMRMEEAIRNLQAPQFQPAPFQQRVNDWMQVCFGAEISADKSERNHRFFEEALELVQALGCSKSEAHQLVDYVYGRPQGEVNQEVGGVMVTLAALCLASGLDMQAGGETELARVWTKVEKIRAKQAAKPKHSPLPAQLVPPSGVVEKAAPTITATQVDFQKIADLLYSVTGASAGDEVDQFVEAAMYTITRLGVKGE